MPYASTFSGEQVTLSSLSTGDAGDLTKATAEPLLKSLKRQLTDLQELLYSAGSHSVLIVLQGMDTSGKGGTIKHVAGSFNPTGCRIVAFKKPVQEELDHDFLWRVHRHAPARGMIAIFDRSHYEDVLIGRVRNLVPEEVWQERYAHINAFERLLTRDSDTIVIKLYLHISKEEQAKRLRAREEDIDKRWKLNGADYVERERWDRYMEAYDAMLERCAGPDVPWHVIPADRKWFRNVAVAETLVSRLAPYERAWRDTSRSRGERNYQELLDLRASLKRG